MERGVFMLSIDAGFTVGIGEHEGVGVCGCVVAGGVIEFEADAVGAFVKNRE
jgi:hypothetical protein